jgi:hypothetical protein
VEEMVGDDRGWRRWSVMTGDGGDGRPAEVPPDIRDGRGYRRMDEMAATGGRWRRWPVMIGDGGDGR